MSGASATGERASLFPAWLTRRRLVAYCRMIAAGYLVLAVALYWTAARQVTEGQTPMVTDFNTFFAIPILLADHGAEDAYRPDTMRQAEQAAVHKAYPAVSDRQLAPVPLFNWLYPPTTTLMLTPLGTLPYWVAYVAWNAVTLLLWLAAVRRILPEGPAASIALALPATFLNGMFGQMGFLTAGLAGLGLTLLAERPIIAGVAFGVLTVKPHFGVLLPVALVCGGHWRSFAAAAVTALALALASWLALGSTPWAAFIAQAGKGGTLLTSGAVPWQLMPTVFPSLRFLGVSPGIASAAQWLAALGACGAVIWAWRGRGPQRLKPATLCLATLLALPFAYAYDLVLLTLPVFWLAAEGIRNRTEEAFVILAALLPFLTPAFPGLGPLVIGGFLVVVLRRLRSDAESAG